MADLAYTFSVTVPQLTRASTPNNTPLTVPPGVVDNIAVRVVPGHNGNLGWALAFGARQVWPDQSGVWHVVTEGEYDYTPPTDWTSGNWSILSYNTGYWTHTLNVVVDLWAPNDLDTPAPVFKPSYIP